jgi:NAD(P)-dependent dehydrogenase (short-subunit alcohol dehydrogenase family)
MMGLTQEQAVAVKEQERARIPLGRRGVPDEVAKWIVRLAGSACGDCLKLSHGAQRLAAPAKRNRPALHLRGVHPPISERN